MAHRFRPSAAVTSRAESPNTLPRPDKAVVELGLVRSRPPCLHECSSCPSGTLWHPLRMVGGVPVLPPGSIRTFGFQRVLVVSRSMWEGWWVWM